MATLLDYILNTAKKTQPTYTPGLPRDPLSNQVGPYNPEYLTVANKIASTGSTIPYSPEYLQKIGIYQPTTDYNATYPTGGASGGSGTMVDPTAEQKKGLIQDIQSKWNTLQNVFGGLFGQVDKVAQEKVNQYNTAYDTQLGDMQRAADRNAVQQAGIYGARGLGSSSYYTNAQNEASDALKQNTDALTQDRSSKLASIGQYVGQQKSSFDAAKNRYADYMGKLNDYGVSDLSSLQNSLTGSISDGQQQQEALKTTPEYLQQLGNLTPYNQMLITGLGSNTGLGSKLQNLITSSAPTQAKKYIAQGLIKASTLNDPNARSYWSNYFDNLLGGQ